MAPRRSAAAPAPDGARSRRSRARRGDRRHAPRRSLRPRPRRARPPRSGARRPSPSALGPGAGRRRPPRRRRDRERLDRRRIRALCERIDVAVRRNAYLIERAWALDAATMRLLAGLGAPDGDATSHLRAAQRPRLRRSAGLSPMPSSWLGLNTALSALARASWRSTRPPTTRRTRARPATRASGSPSSRAPVHVPGVQPVGPPGAARHRRLRGNHRAGARLVPGPPGPLAADPPGPVADAQRRAREGRVRLPGAGRIRPGDGPEHVLERVAGPRRRSDLERGPVRPGRTGRHAGPAVHRRGRPAPGPDRRRRLPGRPAGRADQCARRPRSPRSTSRSSASPWPATIRTT